MLSITPLRASRASQTQRWVLAECEQHDWFHKPPARSDEGSWLASVNNRYSACAGEAAVHSKTQELRKKFKKKTLNMTKTCVSLEETCADVRITARRCFSKYHTGLLCSHVALQRSAPQLHSSTAPWLHEALWNRH